MPIKGLTENKRMPRLGKIHLGIKKKNQAGVEYPSAVDYFVCPDEVLAIIGEDKPKELKVMIPIEDTENWASQFYRCYSRTRGLICKGDGETATRTIDTKTGDLANRDTTTSERKVIPCQGRDCPDYGRQCKEVMNLQFLLPDVPGLGVWQIDTSSINSIRNINSAAELIRGVLGRVSMIPLLLTIEPQQVTSPVDGKLKTVHVLNLRVKEKLIDMMKMAQLPPSQVLLPAPDETELPISDDETPELLLPQNQEVKTKKKAPKEKVKDEPKPVDVSTIEGIQQTEDLFPDEPEPKPEPKAKAKPKTEPKTDDGLVTQADIATIHATLTFEGLTMTDLGVYMNGKMNWNIKSLQQLKKWQKLDVLAAIKSGALK